jgi:hypothetical protein
MNSPNPREIGIVVALILVIGAVLAAIAPELIRTSDAANKLSASQTALAITQIAINSRPTTSPSSNVETQVAMTVTALAPKPTLNSGNAIFTDTPTVIVVPASDGISDCSLQEMVSSTNTIDDLIAKLNEFYRQHQTQDVSLSDVDVINGPVVFWVDLGSDAIVPSDVIRVRTQGNWGIFRLQPNSSFTVQGDVGGRFLPVISCNPGELQARTEPTSTAFGENSEPTSTAFGEGDGG